MKINKNQRNTNKRTNPGKRNEGGYALIGLMAVMMFALILTTAAAPTLRQEMQREKEEEMLWRGQQVAMGIKRYRLDRGGVFPTDLNDLIKVTEVNGKRKRYMRPSAMCDPMMPCTGENNWRLVHPGDPLPAELLSAISETQERSQMPINPQGIQELARFAQLGAANANLPGQPADTQLDGKIGPVENQGDSSGSISGDQKAPIIGVVSRKNEKMFRSYFGIDQYDHALFFQDIPVMAGGFTNPFVLGATVVGGAGVRDPRCPQGGVLINGQCYGNVIPGEKCRVGNTTVPCASLKR